MKKPERLMLFSGMGADRRLMQPIQIPGIEVLTPDHIEPAPAESLIEYAAKIADLNNISDKDVIGGASFGGMIAAQIARQRPVAGLILLGTCIHPSRLPWIYKWVERMGNLVPNGILGLRSWRPFIHWRFAPVTPEAEEFLAAMAKTCPPSRIREFGRMAIGWPGVSGLNCPVLSIHGEHDRIIPLDCAEPGLILQGAGHAFTLTHAQQTISAIQEFLQTKMFDSAGGPTVRHIAK
jgi:pimeloyl-ACP methyl ester carboxylesterase